MRQEAYRYDENGTDEKLATSLAARILDLYPRCPSEEARTVAKHTAKLGSGRMQRTAAGRRFEEDSVRLAVMT